jgi:hypothetical protein
MAKHHLAVLVLKVLIESKVGCRLSQHGSKRRPTHRRRIASQVVAVELDQVEDVEEHAGVVATVTDSVEGRDAVITAGDRLAIDDAGTRAQTGQRLDNQREAPGQVIGCRASRGRRPCGR